MAQSVAAGRDQRVAEARAGNLFALAWRQSRRHQPWLCLLAVLIVPLTMVPLELQRRIIDRAIGLQNSDLLLWLGAIYLVVALLQGGLKYLLRLYGGMVGERTILDLRRAVQSRQSCGVEGETVSRFSRRARRASGPGPTRLGLTPDRRARASGRGFGRGVECGGAQSLLVLLAEPLTRRVADVVQLG